MAAHTRTTTRRAVRCTKHAFAPSARIRPRSDTAGDVTLPGQGHDRARAHSEHASGTSGAGNDPVNAGDPSGLYCADALDPFSSGFGQCWSSGYKKAGHDVAHGTVGVCISGVIGAGPGGAGQVCFVESQGFKHAGVAETLGGGGQSPAAGFSLGLQFSNATSPNDLGGLFGYANGSVVIGPDAGVTAGGSGFVGENACNRTIAGANVDMGLGAKFPLPGSAGAGVSNTWVQNLW